MTALELAEILELALEKDNWCQECGLENTKPIAKNAADMLRQQAKEIEDFKFVLRNLTLATSKKIGELEEELEAKGK